MVLSDWPRHKTDTVFFHSRGNCDYDGLFGLAYHLKVTGQAKFIAINGFDGFPNAPGKAYSLQMLEGMNVERFSIFLSEPSLNTKEESNTFVKLSQKNNWKSAIIITQPHQLLRAFLGAVKSIETQEYPMRLYAARPLITNWWKNVFGSQGTENKERFGHIPDELKRITIYQEKGDLCTFEEFFEYMRNREKIP